MVQVLVMSMNIKHPEKEHYLKEATVIPLGKQIPFKFSALLNPS